MHLCLTVECIASSLHFLQHCLSVFQSISFNQIRSHPPPPPPAHPPEMRMMVGSVSTQMNAESINPAWVGELEGWRGVVKGGQRMNFIQGK